MTSDNDSTGDLLTLRFSFISVTFSRHTGRISYTLNVASQTMSTELPISFAHCSFSLPSTENIHISRISERLSLATLFIFVLAVHCFVGFSLVAASGGYSLVAVSRSYSLVAVSSFSLWWLLLLQTTASSAQGLH